MASIYESWLDFSGCISCFPVAASLREATLEALHTRGAAEGISKGPGDSGQWTAAWHVLQEGNRRELGACR